VSRSPLRPVILACAFLLLAQAAAAQTPGPPLNLTATLNSNNTISLQWTPPATGGAPTGYVVQIGTTPGANDVLNEQIGNVTSYTTTITVPPGASYYVRVRALNSSGVSVASNELTITRTCISPTEPPSSVAWRPISGLSVQLSWVQSADVSDYRVEVGTTPGASDVAVFNVGGGSRTFVTVSLPAAGTYYARVRAVRSCGIGPPTEDLRLVTTGALASTTVVINEFGSFVELKNISTIPVDISFWRIHTTTGVDQVVTRVATIRQGTILAPGCTYLLAVAGSVSVAPDEPLASNIVDGVAVVRNDGFIVDAAGRANSFDIASPDTPYIEGQPLPARRDSVGIASFARVADQDTNNNANDFIALGTATPQNSTACSTPPPPPPPPPSATPQPPTNLTATTSGNVVALAWTAPPPASGGALLNYQLEAGFSPGAANAGVFDIGPNVTAIVFNGVPNGIYYVRVRAVNSAGVSGPSNEAVIVVCGVGCTPAPGAVTNLTFQVSGSNVLLNWTAPSSGPSPTGYVIEAGTAPGLANIGQFPTGSTAAFVIVGGVPPGTYYVRVRALNGSTLGPASNEVVITVP
jgi:hypothetical protein